MPKFCNRHFEDDLAAPLWARMVSGGSTGIKRSDQELIQRPDLRLLTKQISFLNCISIEETNKEKYELYIL